MMISRSVYAAANGIISLFFMTNIPFYIYIYMYIYIYIHHIFFIHLSVYGHLGCFRFLAIINNAAICLFTLGCMHLFELEFSPFPDICPEVGLLDFMSTLFLTFQVTSSTVLHS